MGPEKVAVAATAGRAVHVDGVWVAGTMTRPSRIPTAESKLAISEWIVILDQENNPLTEGCS